MSDNAVITGMFADLKTIKTRSSIQIVIEVPVEYGKRVIDVLGFPQPGAEVPVVIARLQQVSAPMQDTLASTGGETPDAGEKQHPEPSIEHGG